MPFPSDDQRRVIEHIGKPLVVVAAPGTGKTRTIVERMIRLLQEEPKREVSFITFTRSSRRDTDKKVRSAVGEGAFDKNNFIFPRISTLHTYAKSIVHKYASVIGRDNAFSILINDKNENKILLSELCQDLNINIDLDKLERDLACYRCTNSFPSDSPIPSDRREEILQKYDSLLKYYNTFDMEGIVQNSHKILSHPEIDFPKIYLQVDEYQDLNPKDQELVKLISSTAGSQIIVVGDDAQSIYSFRHANYKGIRDLWEDDNWEHVRFAKSHRMPTNILRASQALISGENYVGGEVEVPEDDGKRILTLQCTKSDLQIDAVANLITKYKTTKTNRNGEPLKFSDIMVLCPTSNFVNKVADCLANNFSIPSIKKEKPAIPDDHWRLLLVLRMLDYQDSLALRQWLTIIGIQENTIKRMRSESVRLTKSLFDYCSQLTDAPINELFVKLRELNACLENIEEFRAKLLSFPHLYIEETLFTDVGITINEVTQQPNSIRSIIKSILEKFGLIDTEAEISDDFSEEDKVLVTTLYSAKGLEAEYVFIMWLNDKFFPSPNKDAREELRVFYVGMTRAKQDAIFTFHETYNNKTRRTDVPISPFLQKISSYINVVRITRPDLNRILSSL